MENLNSVCYVGVIGEIRPIEGADNIELAMVGGWQAITKKGEYEVGNKVVVATTDAVIPVELSDLMVVTGYLRKGQRVRTVKLRGVYSECLLIPFKYLAPKSLENNVSEGHDMMNILGITKYEPPVKMVEMSVGGRKFKYHQNPNFHVYYKFPNLSRFDGFNKIIAAASPVLANSAPTTFTSITAANIDDILDQVYANIPAAVAEKDDLVCFLGIDA